MSCQGSNPTHPCPGDSTDCSSREARVMRRVRGSERDRKLAVRTRSCRRSAIHKVNIYHIYKLCMAHTNTPWLTEQYTGPLPSVCSRSPLPAHSGRPCLPECVMRYSSSLRARARRVRAASAAAQAPLAHRTAPRARTSCAASPRGSRPTPRPRASPSAQTCRASRGPTERPGCARGS